MTAGWYPDSSTAGQQRYWDGTAWTEHVAPNTSGTVAVPASASVMPHYGGAVQPGYVVAPKSPALSLIVSFFIPGVGSMMNGDVGKGIGILAGWFISLLLTVVLVGIIGVIGFFVWGLVDAYTGAQKWNRRHGILS